jgi:hypothetical protein
MKNYKLLSEEMNDLHVLEIVEGEFAGCRYTYGEIKFDEMDESVLHFDYNITNGFTIKKDRMEDFVRTIGDNLVELITEAVEHQEVIYKGGT